MFFFTLRPSLLSGQAFQTGSSNYSAPGRSIKQQQRNVLHSPQTVKCVYLVNNASAQPNCSPEHQNQAEASHGGHGNAFSFQTACGTYSLVIQGSQKALLPPCTHQDAATPPWAQLPSLLSPLTPLGMAMLPPSHVPG